MEIDEPDTASEGDSSVSGDASESGNEERINEESANEDGSDINLEADTIEEPPIEEPMFEILGSVNIDQKPKVERVLPDWLANPTKISTEINTQSSESDFEGLDHILIDILKKNHVKSFFPVQKAVIPWIIETNAKSLYYRPSDLCVSAPTGSGKTLAYVLPVVQALKERVVCSIRALVVLPVKELSKQVFTVFKTYTAKTSLKVGIIGGRNFQEEQKLLFDKTIMNQYRSSFDILISTSSRLIDHICNTPGFSLKDLRFLIIDEADRMMEDTGHNWLQFVEKAVFGDHVHTGCLCLRSDPFQRIGTNVITPCTARKISTPCQKLLFSATLSHDPYKLQKLSLFNPKLFTTVGQTDNEVVMKQKGNFTGRYRTPEELTEQIVICDDAIKPLVVWFMLNRFKFTNVLCFTNSVESTHRLCLFLGKMGDVKVGEISSHLLPNKRTAIFRKFQKKNLDILVCTDGMARGIDFEDVDYVFNYDRPKYPETYIHRIGRTARAGRKGTAITIVTSKRDLASFKKLIRTIEKEEVPQLLLPYSKIKELTSQYNQALQEVSQCVQESERKLKQRSNPYALKKFSLSKRKLLQQVRMERAKKKLSKQGKTTI